MEQSPVFEERAPHEAGFAKVFAERILPIYRERRAEGEEAGRKARRTARIIFGTGVALAVVLWLLGPILGAPLWLPPAIILVLFGIAALVWVGLTRQSFNEEMKAAIAPHMTEFMGLTYYHKHPNPLHVDIVALRSAYAVGDYTRSELEDGMTGLWRGVPWRMAEVQLKKRRPGKDQSDETSVFAGLVLEIESPKEMPFILFLSDRGEMMEGLRARFALPKGLQRLDFPDAEVEKAYAVYTDDVEAARAAITPAFGHTLLAIARAHARDEKAVAAAFRGNMFHLALRRPGHFFEIDAFEKSETEVMEACRTALSDMATPREVIDLLIDGPPPD